MRVLPCPKDWSLGTVYTRAPEDTWRGSDTWWAYSGSPARGPVYVPTDLQVRLWASQRRDDGSYRSPTDLTPLRGFEPNALDSLYVGSTTPDQLRNIEHLHGLRELSLNRPDDDAVAAANFEGLTQLRGLEMFYAAVTDRTVRPLLECLPQIAYLFLPGTGVGDDTLRTAGELEDLTVAKLVGTAVTDDGVRALAGSDRLREIDLSKTGVTDAAVGALASCTGLIEIDLSGTHVTDAGIRELAACSRLRKLSLSDTRVTDEGLAFLGHARDLRSLNLKGTNITGSVLEALAQLPQLEVLQLWETSIGDEELRHLHGMSQLRLIAVNDEEITPSGLITLLDSLPSLQYVCVGYTLFRSKKAVKELKERLRQAPSGAPSLRQAERPPVTTIEHPWSGTWRAEPIPAHAGHGAIRSIVRASTGPLWVAGFDEGLTDRSEPPSWARTGWSPPAEGVCVLEGTSRIAVGPDDSVWATRAEELWRYGRGGWHREIGPANGYMHGVTAAPGLHSAHAFRWSGTLYTIRNGVVSSKKIESLRLANCMATDAEGAIWIGSSDGVSKLENGTWRRWKGSADGLPVVCEPGMDDFAWERRDWTPVTSVAIDPAGTAWVAGNGGIARLVGDRWKVEASCEEFPEFFHDITADADGRVYATGGRHLATYDNGTWRIAEVPEDLLAPEARLWAMHAEPDGVWVGASDGALLQFIPDL